MVNHVLEKVFDAANARGRRGLRRRCRAGSGPTKFTPPGHLLSPWTGLAMLCGYTAAVLVAAALTISRRDA